MWTGRRTGVSEPPYGVLQDRRFLGWNTITLYPGESLVSRIHSTPGNRTVFILAEGVHELSAEWDIDQQCTVMAHGATVLLAGADARVRFTTPLCSWYGGTIESGDDHLSNMMLIESAYTRVEGVRFWMAQQRAKRAGVTAYPVELTNLASRCSIVDNVFVLSTSRVPLAIPPRCIYVDDAITASVVTGNYADYDTAAIAPGRSLVSIKHGVDNECGQAAVTPAGTYRSFSNYMDVEVRP